MGSSESASLNSDDKYALCRLMTLAIEKKSKVAIDCLLREKGAALCVDAKHVAHSVLSQDQDMYDAFIASGVPRYELAAALRDICLVMKEKLEGKHPQQGPIAPAMILDLFNRTDPIEITPEESRISEEGVAERRQEAIASLASANEGDLLWTVLQKPNTPSNAIEQAFRHAVHHGREHSFNVLLPRVSAAKVQEAFDSIGGLDRLWNAGARGRGFIPRLIDSGAKDPDSLVNALIHLADKEGEERKDGNSPAALSILNHPEFPTDRCLSLYIEIGLKNNPVVREALAAKPGVHPAVVKLYNVVLGKDLQAISETLKAIEAGQETALQTAAQYGLTHEFSAGTLQIVENAADRLDLKDLTSSAQYISDTLPLRFLVQRGVEIDERNIETAMNRKDKTQMAILLEGNNGPKAASIYLARIDGDKDVSQSFLSDRKDLFEMLRAKVE